jgi:hypothetical protein
VKLTLTEALQNSYNMVALRLTQEVGGAVNLVSMTRSARGTIWISRSGRVSVLEEGRLTPLDFGSKVKTTGVLGLGAGQDGALWVVIDGQIRKWNGTAWAEQPAIAWDNSPVLKLIETRKGVLVAGDSARGCRFIFPGSDSPPLQFNRTNDFPSDWVNGGQVIKELLTHPLASVAVALMV